MAKHILAYIFCILIWMCFYHDAKCQSSQQYKKVGLCLSGGGAKGLAHIGLLKIIDSLGIKIDFITGTSMGSIVGALYACGYSGKQIDSIARSADWDKLLSRYVGLSEIFIDEKDEYQRYITELPLSEGKPNFAGLIDGQELMNLLTRLTLPVAHIKNFDELPIPFHCMAVDIITVQPVEIKSGNLALAMRSSMSIPTIFNPVKYDNYLFVDGGLLENFPVHQVKKMGADFVIGSYTGGKLYTEDELITIDKILVQSSLYYSIQRASTLEQECNIMNNLTNGMGKLSAGSFNKSSVILDSGDAISALKIPELVALAEMQKKEGRIKNISLPMNLTTPHFNISETEVMQIKTNAIREFANTRIVTQPGDKLQSKNLDESVRRLYGSRNFNLVYYELFPDSDAVKTIFHAPEDYKVRIKPAIHYDNERGAGIILNLTLRNVLGQKSRLLATIDLAEAPKIRLHYRRYFSSSNWSINGLIFAENAEQRIYQPRTGFTTDIYSNRFATGLLGISFAPTHSAMVSFSAFVENGIIKPKLENDLTVRSEINQIGLNVNYIYNTLDRPYYTRKGNDVFVSIKLPYYCVQAVESNQTFIDSSGNTQKTNRNAELVVQPYLKSNLRLNFYKDINRKLTLNYAIFQGFTFQNIISRTEENTLNEKLVTTNSPINDYFFIGGTDQRSRPYLIGLAGLREGELLENNFYTLKIGLQYETFHKLFVSVYSQYHQSATSPEALIKNAAKLNTDFEYRTDSEGDQYASMVSFSGSVGYMTPLGPLNIFVSKASSFESWRTYFSFGFKF